MRIHSLAYLFQIPENIPTNRCQEHVNRSFIKAKVDINWHIQ